MIQIELTKGQVAIVDDIDSDLANFKWCCNGGGYAMRSADIPRKYIYMHRVIMERMLGRSLVKGEQVDHINMDKLDNRRSNLRLATASENQRNRGANDNNTSGFKGVNWHKHICKWRAQIWINGKNKNLGYFDTPELAHEAYKQAAIKYHGEFAKFE